MGLRIRRAFVANPRLRRSQVVEQMFAQMPVQETRRASARLLAGSQVRAMLRLLETRPRQQERILPLRRILQAHQAATVVAVVEMVVTGKSGIQ